MRCDCSDNYGYRIGQYRVRTMPRKRLKTNMLCGFRDNEASGEELTVMDRSRPVLLIQPIEGRKSVEEVSAPFH